MLPEQDKCRYITSGTQLGGGGVVERVELGVRSVKRGSEVLPKSDFMDVCVHKAYVTRPETFRHCLPPPTPH